MTRSHDVFPPKALEQYPTGFIMIYDADDLTFLFHYSIELIILTWFAFWESSTLPLWHKKYHAPTCFRGVIIFAFPNINAHECFYVSFYAISEMYVCLFIRFHIWLHFIKYFRENCPKKRRKAEEHCKSSAVPFSSSKNFRWV